jgi:hypothetical protein
MNVFYPSAKCQYQTFEPKQQGFKLMASLDYKTPNTDLSSQTVNFMKCCIKITRILS